MDYEKKEQVFYNELPKSLKPILKKMCEMVKAPYTKIDFKKENWFTLYSWDAKTEEEFIEWLTDYLYNSPAEVRNELMTRSIKNRSYCKAAAKDFVFVYGWIITPPKSLGYR